MNKTSQLLARLKKLPCGLWLFSRLICLKAPYFSTIKPRFTILEAGHAEATMKKRRAVENHLGTVHAIAIANLCELVAGTVLEVSLPDTHRWIPKAMKINYLEKANSDLLARTTPPLDVVPDAGSIFVVVNVTDKAGTTVVSAEIEMYVSKRKPKNSKTQNTTTL
jgi:acyl-coenzyme A thioesterase PaaI-like protein